eukprot:2458925-Pyramimonas_sp.AAC.2
MLPDQSRCFLRASSPIAMLPESFLTNRDASVTNQDVRAAAVVEASEVLLCTRVLALCEDAAERRDGHALETALREARALDLLDRGSLGEGAPEGEHLAEARARLKEYHYLVGQLCALSTMEDHLNSVDVPLLNAAVQVTPIAML